MRQISTVTVVTYPGNEDRSLHDSLYMF